MERPKVGISGGQYQGFPGQMGLEALIALESAKRLANLAGTEKCLRGIPRRRMA